MIARHAAAAGAGLAAALLLPGCGQRFDDPLAGATGTSSPSPTVLVDIQTRAVTLVAEAIDPSVVARAEPLGMADVVAELDNPLSTGGPLVFQVVDASRRGWLEVLLPVRPNGTTGWIRSAAVALSRNPYRLEIDTARHELTLLEGDETVLVAPVGIGTGDTPTPLGSFYLTELLRPPDPSGPYGTHAFGLSGFSETLESFNGGEGVIGIHGTNDPDSVGSDVSHGCIRVTNDTIDQLAAVLPLGTPVFIS
jgi:lipoprotein-anchoring transpeptidase ErfK/SrfK